MELGCYFGVARLDDVTPKSDNYDQHRYLDDRNERV
jgi:hypothetical protein